MEVANDYRRMGVTDSGAGSSWRLDSDINRHYSLCSTYSRLLAVPSSASADGIRAVAQYRSRQRIPALSWRDNGSGVALMRGAQPCTGPMGRSSSADEDWVRKLRHATGTFSGQLALIDARSSLAAHGNKLKGGGVEKARRYGVASIHYCGLRNVHAVRRVMLGVQLGLAGAQASWRHLQANLLRGASVVATHLARSTSVLLHCSDGWDRTPQLTSLAMLLLDPYYRTVGGLALLIQKEWLDFGHRFALRRRRGQPIFVQFLDAIWQLLQQMPRAFAFNEAFLEDLAAAHDGVALPSRGTPLAGLSPFDGDCEAERVGVSVQDTWAWVQEPTAAYLNPRFDATAVPPAGMLIPLPVDSKVAAVRVWGRHGRVARGLAAADQPTAGATSCASVCFPRHAHPRASHRIVDEEGTHVETEMTEISAK